ncbi:MAG: TIGR04076 family protein [Oscillospiraceae bacterium]|nr:TIGR04076 family protein [Oscillospiraceae bacterium]
MKKVRITAIRKACYRDLMEQYENPIEHACDVEEGQVWIANGWNKPEGFCDSAWDSISPFVMTLAHGGGDFYDGWMKNPKSAMISCNDGFRPVSFYLEALEEDVF